MQDQPASQPPMHTTVLHTETQVVRIELAEPDSGYWHKVLWWYVDAGAMASLSGPGVKVMDVFLRHRSPDGTSWPSLPVLLEKTGQGRSAVYGAIKELMESPFGLLSRPDPKGPYVVFPGRSFATRRTGSVTEGSPHLRAPRIFRSAGADDPSADVDRPSTAADPLLRREQIFDDASAAPRQNEKIDGDDDGVAALVARAGKDHNGRDHLRPGDVRPMLRRHDRAAVETGIDNTLWTKRQGKLKKAFAACVWNQLRYGYGVFDEVERAREADAVVERARRLASIVQPLMTEEHEQLFTAAWRPPNVARMEWKYMAKVLRDEDLVGDPDAVYARLVVRAEGILDARNGTPAGRTP